MIEQDQSNPIVRFFSRPYVGIAGSIASVIGVLFAIYFFVAAKETRQLTYLVHPVKSILVASGQSSALSVEFGGQEISGDVTAAQLAFWNEGKRSIKPENMLRPFVIQVGDNAPIFEARIRKVSRDVVNLTLDTTRIKEGVVAVNWSILEHDDGGIVQLVFAGDTATPITATAVVEGQREVDAIEFPGTIRSPAEQYARAGREYRMQGWAFLVLSIVIFFPSSFLFFRARRRRQLRVMDWAMLSYPLLIAGLAIYFLLKAQILGPPFGF